MKPVIIIPVYLLLFIFISCAEETESSLNAFNPEAFVFDIGEEYEVNASVRVKGFQMQQEGEEYMVSVGYELDLIKPDGTSEKGFLSKVEDFVYSEKVADAGIDIQFNLDTTYSAGNYKIIFNLRDTYSGSTASASADFKISE